METNRKTNIPVKTISRMTEALLRGCTLEELLFMQSIADSKRNFGLLTSIFTNLTQSKVNEIFYLKGSPTEAQLMRVWLANRAEVAGLMAFRLACQAAGEEINRRRKILEEKKRGREDV